MSPDSNTPEMQQALQALLKLAGMAPSAEEISAGEVAQAVEKLTALVMQLGASRTGSTSAAATQASALIQPGGGGYKSILIAGQLGIVTHQLRQNLTKLGASVTIAKDMDEAISEYKNQDYSLVIIDLFMPTEREGFIVLDEIKRTSMVCNIQTHIIVLAPPTKDKTIPERSKTRGASVFLEKSEGWHKAIVQYANGELDITQG